MREGEELRVGQRVGVMKFGSRMDVFLPVDLPVLVTPRDRVVAGVTVLGAVERPMTPETPPPPVERRGLRRGVLLLPSLFTLANLFCGWACVVYAMRGQFHTAAPFIGVAIVLDMLDGRIARMTGSSSAFGVEFDSLADLISFGMAPAALTFQWGLAPLGRLGWAIGFIYLAAAAVRLARFNIQRVPDKRYFVGLPSPSAAAIPAATIFFASAPITDRGPAFLALAILLVPALLMVSTIRFRSLKNLDLDLAAQLQGAGPGGGVGGAAVGLHRGSAGGDGLHLPRLAAHRVGRDPGAAPPAVATGRRESRCPSRR